MIAMAVVMAQYLYEVFVGQQLSVDGDDYHTCCFKNCILNYEGGEPPRFVDCAFVDSIWLLGRVVVTQVRFLSIFNASESSELIDHLIHAIQSAAEVSGGELTRGSAAA
jgi:hypothetical protein